MYADKIFKDKTMMARWGLEGMRSFEQVNVAKKEEERLVEKVVSSALNVERTVDSAQVAATS